MRRILSSLLLVGALAAADLPPATALPSAGLPTDGELLAAARTANVAYQKHIAALQMDLASPEPDVRLATLRLLGNLQDPQAIVPLITFIEAKERTPDELSAAAAALAACGNPAAVPALRKLSAASNAGVRLAAYNALSQLNAATPGDHTQRAKDSSTDPHLAALTNLGTIKQADAAPLLVAGLNRHQKSLVRRMCAIGLGRLGDAANGPALQNALCDADPQVRRYAAEALVAVNYRPAIPYMIFALESNIASDEINRCIMVMTGQDFGFSSRNDALKRQEAIDRGFLWWTLNADKS